MNVEEFYVYCMFKKGVEEIFFFDEEILVFKVMGKMFVFIGLEYVEFCVNFKCDLDWVIEL